MRGAGATVVATALGVNVGAESNWPQWRGPLGNGISPDGNPPVSWDEDTNIAWKVAIPGQGHGTPAIWGDKIFVLAAVPTGNSVAPEPGQQGSGAPGGPGGRPAFGGRPGGDGAPGGRPGFGDRPGGQGGPQGERPGFGQGPGGERPPRGPGGRGGFGGRGGLGGFGGGAPTEEFAYTTMCLDRETGETLWSVAGRTQVPSQSVQPSNRYSAASAVTDGERVYAYFGDSGLYCYDMEGNELWSQDIPQASVTFGDGSSPALHDGRLVLIRDTNDASFIVTLDAKTGTELWREPRDEGSGWSTPSFLERDGKIQVLTPGANAVRAYDLDSGDLLWSCSGLGSNPIPKILFDDEAVYAMSGHRNPKAMAIELGGRGDLTSSAIRWEVTRGTSYVPSGLLYDDRLFFLQRTSGIATLLDPETGDAFYEQERIEGVDGVYASPIGVNGHIYVASQNGTTAVLESSDSLKVVSVNELDDGFDASPVVVGDELYLRGRANLYKIAAQ